MTKQELTGLLKKMLKTGADLDFLSKLEPVELETLIAGIRDTIEQRQKGRPPSPAG